MERQILFRDYQEQQAQDHRDLQDFARASIDHVVHDAVTATRRFSGFTTTKTAQVEVQVTAGRFYDIDGSVYNRSTTLVQSLLSYLPAAAKRYVSITAYGNETETDVEERDFLVDVETGRTEPDAVATVKSRDAVLAIVSGAESADPQPPAIPITSVEIARVLLDTTQVVTVTMMTGNRIASTELLDTRATALETFKGQIEPRVASLASDLAALANAMKQKSTQFDMSRIYEDLARVKARVEIPATASDYGADRFLDDSDSDSTNSQSLGYDAMVMEGVRFPDANADIFELAIFSANDPNAALQNGLLLPAYDSVFKMGIYPFHSDLGIAQYGFQTFDLVQKTISRTRLRYGAIFTACTNSAWFRSGQYDPVTQTFRIGDEVWNVLDRPDTFGGNAHFPRFQQVWQDTYTEEYWDFVVIEHHITGAQVAQTFLNANDMWLTKFRFFLTVKAANEAVLLSLCEVTNGLPDLSKCILHQSVPHTDLIVGDWTAVNVSPTFLKSGKRYAVVLTSNANHKIGMASGQNYLDGTFFYSTDGAYFQGDLTKDMMLEVWGARFRAPQVAIELAALNLDGGIKNIDILAGMIVPESTDLIFEVQPGGSGAWVPLKPEDLSAFNSTPPLARFRARFAGTRDIAPGLMLTGSRCKVSRPKLAFVHVSEVQTLAGASDDITVKVLLEAFDDTPHDLTCRLRIGGSWEDPAATVTQLLDAADKRYARSFHFTPGSPTDTFSIELNGTTNSAGNTFHVAERIHWAV